MSPWQEKNLFFSNSFNFCGGPQISIVGRLPFGCLSLGRGYMKLYGAHKSNILYSGNYNIWEFIQIPFGFISRYR